MLKVTVQLKFNNSITIWCNAHNDIVYEADKICVYETYCKWLFMKSEIEYIKIERHCNETQQR